MIDVTPTPKALAYVLAESKPKSCKKKGGERRPVRAPSRPRLGEEKTKSPRPIDKKLQKKKGARGGPCRFPSPGGGERDGGPPPAPGWVRRRQTESENSDKKLQKKKAPRSLLGEERRGTIIRLAELERRARPKRTNLRVTRLSFNRSQQGGCSNKYDTPTQT